MFNRIIKGNKYPVLTLDKYQAINAIYEHNQDSDETDKLLYCVCALFDYAPEVLNKEKPKKVLKMINQVQQVFDIKFDIKKAPEVIGKYKIRYDIDNISFGNYIDLAYFLQFDNVQKAHYIIASVTEGEEHFNRAEYLLQQKMTDVVSAVVKVKEGFNKLNKMFANLFNLDPEINEKANDNSYMTWFNKRYGWIYSAEYVSEYNNIPIEEAYALPIKKALNDLVYLKAKQKYLYLLNKK